MRFKILASLMFLSLGLFSQEIRPKDSLYLFNLAERELRVAKESATALLRYPSEQLSKVSLHYEYSEGAFKGPQTPGSSNRISFEAEGIKKINRFKLYGNFEYSKLQEKDLGNVLRGEGTDDQPFYHIVAKESNFSRQKYHAKGIISYELLKEKLNFSSGFNYIYYLADRSVDPRMALNWFDFQMQPELTYITKNWNLGASGLWGYGTEETSIAYKRTEYKTGLQYPERITYLNYGYGYAPISYDELSRRKQYKGGSIYAAGKTGTWNILLEFKYINTSDKNQNELDQSLKNIVYSTYTSETLSGHLLLTRKHKRNLKQLELVYSDLDGTDDVAGFFGKNYTANNKSGGVAFNNADTYGSNTFEWGASLNYLYNYKKDAVTAHLFEYANFRPGISGNWYHTTASGNSYSVGLAPSLLLPFDVSASAPLTQQNAFTLTVMYPDYVYQRMKKGILNLKLGYVSNTLSKDFKTGITLNTTYIQAIQKQEVTVPAATLPGNRRLAANLSLNLYF
ncbi:hypothetical protein ABIE26_001721 [Pedobacter africanus]|uniref:Uncharacterized protein n=1 Tax=Pedobacter africanus TaxID=151894 RepID=A0ACC6KRE7_9SPHI|nr:DUF6850 family outer membrane beta-barrel protein [Pedobacter africanus]MDR6781791.1 hypothetical protein [Pedobacter africanus]